MIGPDLEKWKIYENGIRAIQSSIAWDFTWIIILNFNCFIYTYISIIFLNLSWISSVVIVQFNNFSWCWKLDGWPYSGGGHLVGNYVMKSRDGADAPLQDYPDRSVWTTWTISYHAIRKKNEATANLLLLWAFLDNKDREFVEHLDIWILCRFKPQGL